MRPSSAALAIDEEEAFVAEAPPTAVQEVELRFRSAANAEALRPEWEQLATQAAEPNPYAEFWFVQASLRHLANAEVRLAEVRRGPELIGVVPLLIEPRYGRVPIAHVQNWRHHHLFLGAPLVRAGAEEPFWRALILALDDARWAPNFLHLRDLAEVGPLHVALQSAATALGRPATIVYREQRALLQGCCTAAEYYEGAVRKKKRKELGRLRNRLGELGQVVTRSLTPGDDLTAWCDDFLKLERAGWKGETGSALACSPETERFFREALSGARRAGRLHFLRMDLDGSPIAMLVNFLTPPGSYSFKTAFDESFARFSPGVLIQIENLAIIERADIDWMDSCAAEDHPMIDSFWRERRSIVRVTVPLAGVRRRLAYATARTLEEVSAARRRISRKREGAASQ